MDIDSPKKPLTKEIVFRSSTLFGVYVLWDGDDIIYIGKADIEDEGGIRAKLERHLTGKCAEETAGATHFQEEYAAYPSARRVKLLEEYRDEHGRYPRCKTVSQPR